MNHNNNIQCTPTTCIKSGIQIHESNNKYKQNPLIYHNKSSQLSNPVNFHNTKLNNIDLDIDHYSLEDLYNLFNIQPELNEETLKYAKQIVLKMHPDKSHLDQKYFLFFSKAYKRLYEIYEFQNKSTKKTHTVDDFYDGNNQAILNNMFENNKDFKDPIKFNSWFNQAFEKHRLGDPNEQGYGDWMKTDEGIMNINENVSKTNMNEIFEEKKKQIKALSVYTGITDTFSSTFGGFLLNGCDNFTSDNYTDLRQAYTETLIPVTQNDYDKMHKFNNINEYVTHRDKVDISPLTYEESEKKLFKQQLQQEEQSRALAFKYAKESELVKQKQNSFWGDIKQLTNW